MKHTGPTTRETITHIADQSHTVGMDNGDLTVFFSAGGCWTSDDAVNGGQLFFDHDMTVIGAVYTAWEDGPDDVYTSDEAYAKFGAELLHDIAALAIELLD